MDKLATNPHKVMSDVELVFAFALGVRRRRMVLLVRVTVS